MRGLFLVYWYIELGLVRQSENSPLFIRCKRSTEPAAASDLENKQPHQLKVSISCVFLASNKLLFDFPISIWHLFLFVEARERGRFVERRAVPLFVGHRRFFSFHKRFAIRAPVSFNPISDQFTIVYRLSSKNVFCVCIPHLGRSASFQFWIFILKFKIFQIVFNFHPQLIHH